MQFRRCLSAWQRVLAPLAIVVGLACGADAQAAEPLDPARLMPETAIGYLEVSQPGPLVEKLLDPALAEALSRTKKGQEYYESADGGATSGGLDFPEGDSPDGLERFSTGSP